MAIATASITTPGSANSLKLCTWAALANGDSGAPLQMPDWADRCVQFTGTFGAGGSVLIEGSMDGVTYSTLNDTTGAAITVTQAGFKQLNEVPLYMRPRVTAGDGTTAIVVSVLARRLVQTSGL